MCLFNVPFHIHSFTPSCVIFHSNLGVQSKEWPHEPHTLYKQWLIGRFKLFEDLHLIAVTTCEFLFTLKKMLCLISIQYHRSWIKHYLINICWCLYKSSCILYKHTPNPSRVRARYGLWPNCGHLKLHKQFWPLDPLKNFSFD